MNVVPILERIMPKVAIASDGCWEWFGARDNHGYGVIWDQRTGRNRHVTRVVWELAWGVTLPDETEVCHTCDHPPCVRPTHLFTGTHLDNFADARRKGRIRRGEGIPWAKLTEADVREIRRRKEAGETQTAIAKAFGVRQSSVSDIVRGHTWAHLKP